MLISILEQKLLKVEVHINHKSNLVRCKAALLPLFKESINDVTMVKHCLKIILDTTTYLNPSQTAVAVCDQPLYALAKQLQWMFPSEFGDKKLHGMFGDLHLEN